MKRIIAFTDGTGYSPNLGTSNVGALVNVENEEMYVVTKWLKQKLTAPMAEYTAILELMSFFESSKKWRHSNRFFDITIYTDSNLVVNQLNGNWRIDKEHIQEIAEQIMTKLATFGRHEIKFISGKKNPADPLTRISNINKAERVAISKMEEFLKLVYHICNGIKIKKKMSLDGRKVTLQYCPLCGKRLEN